MNHEDSTSISVAPALEFRLVRGDFAGRSEWRRVIARIDDKRLSLDGRGLLRKRPTLKIPLQDIVNVAVDGTQLQFQRSGVKRPQSLFVLRAKTAADAERLASFLPKAQTADFLVEWEKNNLFKAAYKAITPRVYVTPAVTVICVVMYMITGLGGVGWTDPSAEALLRWGGNHWALTTAGQWWRLVTAGFLHSGPIHLALNMQALLVIGVVTERLYGNRIFTLIYVFGLLISSLASIWWTHNTVVVGASGAIFAIGGALVAFIVRHQNSLSRQATHQLSVSAAVFVFYNLVFGFTQPDISNAAHVGGLVAGLLLGFVVSRPLEKQTRIRLARRTAILGATVSMVSIVLALTLIPKSWLDINGDAIITRESLNMMADEQRVLEAFESLLGRFDNKELTATACAKAIDNEIIPAWDKAYSGILAIRLEEDSSEWPRLTLGMEFYRAQRDIMRQMSEALQAFGDDSKNVEAFNQRIARIAQLRSEVDKMFAELQTLGEQKRNRLLGIK